MALQLSALSNGVSDAMAVARTMWCNLWPSVPADEVPITHVTNGVHPQTWLSRPHRGARARFGQQVDQDSTEPRFWQSIDRVPDQELWAAHGTPSPDQIVRQRVQAQLARYANGRDVEASASERADDRLCAALCPTNGPRCCSAMPKGSRA